MAQTFAFYDERAKEAERQAEAASLDNVRERNLRAAKTWRGLADQAKRVAEDKAKADEERIRRREAEQAVAESASAA